jgi:urease accessory protein
MPAVPTTTTGIGPMTEAALGNAGLYRLLAWLSPSFPIGAFSYSHGLEAAAAACVVHDRATLEAWIAAIVTHGSGRIDADILREAHHAAAAGDAAALATANARGLAYRATSELTLEVAAQGEAFLAAIRAAWSPGQSPHPNPPPLAGERTRLQRVSVEHPPPQAGEGRGGGFASHEVCYAAAVGEAAARASIPLRAALIGYLQALAGNLMSAGLRLGLIGQTDGQRILASLEPAIVAAAEAALTRGPEDFGSATFAVDVFSMAHETQYTRLFRS